MNLQQWHARIEAIAERVATRVAWVVARQVVPDTSQLAAGLWVVAVVNCLDCALTPVSTCHECGGKGVTRRWIPYHEAMAQELAAVMDLLAATRPDVAQAVAEWEAGPAWDLSMNIHDMEQADDGNS